MPASPKCRDTWDELTAAAEKLKAAGIQPIIQGVQPAARRSSSRCSNGPIRRPALPVSDWGKILSGELPYNNPTFEAQLDKRHDLYAKGYINEDAFNYPDTVEDFKAGKAAMLLGGGSWQVAELEQGLWAPISA